MAMLAFADREYTGCDDDYGDLVFPTHWNTAAVLEYIGFSKSRSLELLHAYHQTVEDGPTNFTLCEYAIEATIGATPALSNADSDWRAYMESLGLSEATIQRQMNDDVRKVRASSTMDAWIWEILQGRLWGLHNLDKICYAWSRGTKSSGHGQKGSSSKPAQQPSQQGPAGQGEIQQEIREDGTISPCVSVQDVLGDENNGIPGFLSLFKGCRFEVVRDFLSDIPDVADGLDRIRSHTCGDFSPGSALYLTTQKWVAVHYAQGIQRAVGEVYSESPVVLQLLVPNAWFEKQQISTIPYSSAWNQVIWACRRQLSKSDWPPAVKGKIRNSLVVAGPICGVSNKEFVSSLKWEDITEEWVMKNGVGDRSSQHVVGRSLLPSLASVIPPGHTRVIEKSVWSQWDRDEA